METDLRDKQRKNYSLVRSIRDFTMATLILAMGVLLIVGEKLKIDRVVSINEAWGKEFSYFFGGICLLYGGFRLYRGIKKDY